MSYSELAERVNEVTSRISAAVARGGHAQSVRIVAVTKTHGPEAVDAAWGAGIRDVGENKVQEATGKMDQVHHQVSWHLIGHLQRNKVKSLDRFTLFHALDSARLAEAVSRHGIDRGRQVDVLVQVNVTGEETKGGYANEELRAEAERMMTLEGVRILGVMTMARHESDETQLRAAFAVARDARQILSAAGHPATELSMGMSGDYEVAVQEGATIVRLGTTLFGARET